MKGFRNHGLISSLEDVTCARTGFAVMKVLHMVWKTESQDKPGKNIAFVFYFCL